MDDIEQDGRPLGRLSPPDDALQEVDEQIESGEFESAVDLLDDYQGETDYHHDWAHFLKGLGYYGLEHFEAGYSAFELPYEATAGPVGEEYQSERFRLAARCLKKMGWLHRRNEQFRQAYGIHAIGYQYLLEHGSYREIHDATISLDIDAYFLKNATLSRMWLERSIEAARLIKQPIARFKALGMSWNNLAGTLCELKRFEEAEEAMESSLDYWGQYEDRTTDSEHRRVWAQYGIGDVYQRWGQHLDEVGHDAAEEKLEAARDALTSAIDMAQQEGMTTGTRQPIESKLERIKGTLIDDEE